MCACLLISKLMHRNKPIIPFVGGECCERGWCLLSCTSNSTTAMQGGLLYMHIGRSSYFFYKQAECQENGFSLAGSIDNCIFYLNCH